MEKKEVSEWKDSFARKLVIPIILIWIVLAIIFGFTDLQISIGIVDENSIWAKFIADYGEYPGWIMVFISIYVLIGSVDRSGKGKYIIFIATIIIAIILLLYRVIDELVSEGNLINIGIYEYFLIPSFGIVIGLILHFVFKKIPSDKFQPYIKFGQITLLLAIINPLILIQIVKLLWGRVRFRDLTPPGYPEFTPWFIPQGYTGNQSFPSGHCAMGWMLLPLILLILDKNKVIKYLAVILVIAWGIIEALGRIVIGAHYASDTLFSTGMAVVIFLFLYKKYYFSTKSN